MFEGEENKLTLNQTHNKKFHCTYLLHFYPFDTQICRVDLQLEKFSQVQPWYNYSFLFGQPQCVEYTYYLEKAGKIFTDVYFFVVYSIKY